MAVLNTTALFSTEKGREHLKFVDYPDFPEQHSTWGSIGYSERFDRVVIGVTDHFDKIVLYSYDPISGKIEKGGDIAEMGNLLRPYQWQGKIHSQMIENQDDGWIYFGTDSGLERWTHYAGGYFMKYHPVTHELENLGLGYPDLSIKDFGFDQVRNRMYGITLPDNYVLVKDLETKTTRNLGSFNKKYSGRVTFTDDWGSLYLADDMGRLVKYEPATDKIHFSEEKLPVTVVEGDTAWRQSYGLIAWARYRDTQNYYLITYTRHLLKFTPQEHGIGKIEDLGLIYDGADVPVEVVVENGYTPNLTCSNNHKLYYWVGGHDLFLFENTSVLIECDPETREKRIVYRLPRTEVEECTGSGVIDKHGNLYFAGRRHVEGREAGESGSSVPNLIIFNPERAIADEVR